MTARRLPRRLHPGAWWLWSLGLATAASRTTDPILLLVLVAVAGFVVSARRAPVAWAGGFRAYLVLGAVIIGLRLVFRALLDGQAGQTVLFRLPEIPLPSAAAGIRIGGPVSAEGLVAALYDGLRLAALLACLGAANALADPKRLLKAVPAALHEIGVAVTVSLTIAPQLVESGRRVQRAQRLRGGGEPRRRRRPVHRTVLPVVTDALERSLALAASMDGRGYGRRVGVPGRLRLATGVLTTVGLLGVCVGTYGLLDGTTSPALGLPFLAGGLAVAVAGLVLGGRTAVRTRYRPDPWRAAEWAVGACGVAAAAVFVAIGSADPTALHPSAQPLAWPSPPPLAAVGLLLAALPAFLAPPTLTAAPAPAAVAA